MSTGAYKPQLNPERCGSCGICQGACPAKTFSDLAEDTDTVRGQLIDATQAQNAKDLPPCREACPLQQDIGAYLDCLAAGDQAGALDVIIKDNPLPAVLGHVCHHPCESACASGAIQHPPSIRELKRFAALASRPPVKTSTKKDAKVAIVGSGPAGLAAAWALGREGVQATIYEALMVAGGMLAWAIPPFRLPREALADDINYVLDHGVQLKLNTRLSPKEVMDLRQKNTAVILACGAPKAKTVKLPGTKLGGVWPGLDFLKNISLGPLPEMKDPVVIVGGGNVALDAARWALRLASDVTLLYRRDRKQMPGYAEEITAAEAEGLKFVYRAQPTAIDGDGQNKACALNYIETEPVGTDDDGRQKFKPVGKNEKSLAAKTIILALGQETEAGLWEKGLGLKQIKTDKDGLQAEGLYGIGDLISGPATVVEAMAGGIACARAILKGI